MILGKGKLKELDSVSKIFNPIEDECGDGGRIKHGMGGYTYSLMLSPTKLKMYDRGGEIDPKRAQQVDMYELKLFYENDDCYFLLPPGAYALGVSYELITMPDDVLGICIAKSTYARCGLHINTTLLHPGWSGYLTIEMHNASGNWLRVYAYEGICQLIFLQTDGTGYPYNGLYQNQSEEVTLPMV